MILKYDTVSKYREHLPFELTIASWIGNYAYTFYFKDNILTKKNFYILDMLTLDY
jgi:hypothetical protein